ncbi:hypothetical protein F4804DRAFT_332179 [Jackrogersella minutella]|nr:hypothetical protein F4804DRAFT_332179 [Jackrogersella minutella]
MQISAILATALLPLLAVADTSTTTSTMTMTKYITIEKAASSTIYSANSTSVFPTGAASGSSTFVVPTTASGSEGTPTTAAPSLSPTIDNQNAGAALGSAHVAFVGLAGMVVAALL